MTDTDAATIAALLEELLEELKEVDSAAYDRITSIEFEVRSLNIYEDETAQDIIQGCIQRAIAARPDNWIMSMWTCPAGWQAMIRRGRRGYTDPEYMHIGEDDTPAAAILAAYIEAKRASR